MTHVWRTHSQLLNYTPYGASYAVQMYPFDTHE